MTRGSMKIYTVYILECRNGRFYTGVTSDLAQRLHDHHTRRYPGCYTASRLPVRLVFSLAFEYIDNAINAEKRLKGWSHGKKQALIDGDCELLHLLAECRNETHHLRHGREYDALPEGD